MDKLIPCNYCGCILKPGDTVHIHDHNDVTKFYHLACWREKLVEEVREQQRDMFDYFDGYP